MTTDTHINVGFYAGSYFCELGPRAELQSLFVNIQKYVVDYVAKEDWALLTDRLYRRYIALEETDAVRALMRTVAEKFRTIAFDETDDSFSNLQRSKGSLNWQADTLAEAYEAYFDAFEDVCDEIDLDDLWEGIPPLRILITDSPRVYIEMERPLWVYDDMDGPPLWLVPISEREDDSEEDES